MNDVAESAKVNLEPPLAWLDFAQIAIRQPKQGARVSTIHLHQTTTSTPEPFLAGLTDVGPGRSKPFGNSAE